MYSHCYPVNYYLVHCYFLNVFTGGISDVLIELHKAVLQSIRNGKILHSDKMKEAISENIKRAQIINNQLERKMLSTRKMLEKEKKSPGLYFKATFLLALLLP